MDKLCRVCVVQLQSTGTHVVDHVGHTRLPRSNVNSRRSHKSSALKYLGVKCYNGRENHSNIQDAYLSKRTAV